MGKSSDMASVALKAFLLVLTLAFLPEIFQSINSDLLRALSITDAKINLESV